MNFAELGFLFLSGTLQMVFPAMFALLMFRKPIRKIPLAVFSLAVGLISAVSRMAFGMNSPAQYPVYFISMFLGIFFLLHLKWYQSLIAIFMNLLLSALTQMAAIALIGVVSRTTADHLSSEVVSGDYGTRMILVLVGAAISALLILIFYYTRLRIDLPENVQRRRVLGLIVNAVVVAVAFIPNTIYFGMLSEGINMTMVVFNVIALMVLFGLAIFNSVRSGQYEQNLQDLEYQKLMNETMDHVVNGMRGFKHDYNNMIQSVNGYIAVKDWEGLEQHFGQVKGEAMIINSLVPLNTYCKNHPAIYGILLSKITYSEARNVIININIYQDFIQGQISTYDLVRIMGILIDNAIEAAADSEKRYVEITVGNHPKDDSLLVFEVVNSFAGTVDLESIFQQGFTSKPEHSGFGLWEVKQILAKYRGGQIRPVVAGQLMTQKVIV